MTIRALTVFAATMVAGMMFAQEGEDSSQGENSGAKTEQKAVAVKAFRVLPFCQQVDGIAEVCLPGSAAWGAVEVGKSYPLGASYRTCSETSQMIVAFGSESKAIITGNSLFRTRVQPLGIASRTISIDEGCNLKLNLAKNLSEGSFVVIAPGFSIKNLAGESSILFKTLPDGDEAVIRCVTGSLGIEGRHFEIPQMRAADEIRIRSTVDHLATFLYGNSGDYIVKLDRGIVMRPEMDSEDNNSKEVADKATIDWHLSPKTKVRIDRMVPSVGERLSVSIMTFDAVGELKNHFAYAEGRSEVNSGELAPAALAEEKEKVQKVKEEAEETFTIKVDEPNEDVSKKENKQEE